MKTEHAQVASIIRKELRRLGITGTVKSRVGAVNVSTWNISPVVVRELRDAVVNGYSWCKQPHPAYELTNLGGNIRRLEKRLAEVAGRVERTAKAEQAGILIEGADYVRITFPDKPARDVLSDLRGAGFRWSGGCWCGYRSAIPASVHEMHNEAENCDESV